MSERRRGVVAVVVAAAAVAVATVLVFLVRAGGDPADAATWPITWELRSSDNGVLFQVMQDLVAGRPLDWSFSPQVFVVPELPISALAFLVVGGDLYLYYVAVAVLHAVGLTLAFVALARVLRPADGLAAAAGRALLAAIPLVAFPLVGTSWILAFPLAPSYYAGEYAALVLAPVLLLARSRAARAATGAFLALTIAANPLTLVFAGAAGGIVFVVVLLRGAGRGLRGPLLAVAATLAGAVAARLLLSPLQGLSPLAYVDLERFRGRLAGLGPYLAFQARDPAAAVILTTGAVIALALLAVAAVVAVRLLRRSREDLAGSFATIYLATLPVAGLVGTVLLLITHQYYLWPVLILPYSLALILLPRRAVAPGLAIGGVAVALVAVATGAAQTLPRAGEYLGYRSAETRCLDEAVPGGIGYATFSDARRVGLTSATGVRLLPIVADGSPNDWMANRASIRTVAGTFFYRNGRGDEWPIDAGLLRERFGEPDRVVSCGDDQEIWLYDRSEARGAIADFYGVREPR